MEEVVKRGRNGRMGDTESIGLRNDTDGGDELQETRSVDGPITGVRSNNGFTVQEFIRKRHFF